ncbi:MAG: PhoH family protein [Paracoccaceae bacterium]
MASATFDPAKTEAVKADRLLEFPDNRLLIDLCGGFDRNIAALEEGFDIVIARRGNQLSLHGDADGVAGAAAALSALYQRLESGRPVEKGDVDAAIRMRGVTPPPPNPGQLEMFRGGKVEIRTKKKIVEPRTATQRAYVESLFRSELVFGVGPAGTGKTYLAVAAAVSMFLEGKVDRIILSRPAVEAGERLGFLPGDMKEKIDPYMQPLYDALGDLLPGRQVQKYIEDKVIEIAPLAFMRGRTLGDAFVVLDEAQNATEMQMKMFLTRLGEGGRMAITGDPSQIDLPRGVGSGLVEAERVLAGVAGIEFVKFTAFDVIRHPLVGKIVQAYDADREKGATPPTR